MKHASLKNAVEWIALNDDAGSPHALDVSEVKWLLTVVMIADLFGISNEIVARRVVERRLMFEEIRANNKRRG